MSDSSFHFIWQEWIVPLTEDMLNQADTEFIKRAGLKIRDMNELFGVAKNYFEKKKTDLKIEFYGQDYESQEHLMDFHKLGALLCRTLIQYKVFDFDISECENMVLEKDKKDISWLVKNALINFRVAFYTSVVFVYQSMLFKYDNEENHQLFEKLKKNRCFNLYETHQSKSVNSVHESFENSIVLDLAKRDINDKSFDFLLFATIMYQLEEYNKAIL